MAAEPAGPRGEDTARSEARPRRGWWLLLLLLPFIALLYPPWYSHANPHIWGIPFFYWYQAVWLGITAAISTLVYRLTR